MKNLNDYELSECLFSNDDYSEFLAKDLTTNKTARLVRFSFEVSSIESFRAQFRRDVELLSNVQHFNIVSLQGWGEANGTFFLHQRSTRRR